MVRKAAPRPVLTALTALVVASLVLTIAACVIGFGAWFGAHTCGE